jgi:DNA-binding transcriptional ArsR family regulator
METPTAQPAKLRELVDALQRAGVPVSKPRGKSGILTVDGQPVEVSVRPSAVVRSGDVVRLGRPPRHAVGVVIADRISEPARQELAESGWSWLDRRGHLRFWTKGVRVDKEIEPPAGTRAEDRFASLFPPVGVEVALALLKEPEREWSVKNVAEVIGRSPGGVSERLRALREAGLVDRQNKPMRPDLFWELVGPWHERAFGLADFPAIDGRDPKAFAGLSWLGLPTDWVLTDTQAALLLGAPVVASTDGPPDLYAPQPSIVDLAVSHFGAARTQPAATVRAIRYAGILAREPFRRTPAGLQVAHPVVVALDLAQDRARGREVVEAWDPSDIGVIRVW